MAQLIDKSALVAEIEKCEKVCEDYMALHKDTVSQGIANAKRRVCQRIIEFINTLEVKDVNLEKEIIDWWNANYSVKGYSFEEYAGHYLENSTVIEIAKHFFELGFKAQKGE